MVLTAEETADEFPVGTTVVFTGYIDDGDDRVNGCLRVGQTFTVVGHTTFPSPDGLFVRCARGYDYVLFATEVGHACHACQAFHYRQTRELMVYDHGFPTAF